MLRPAIGKARKVGRRVVWLGAHCDDIEIGCGGTILRLLREEPGCEVHWQVFSSTPVRKREAAKSAALFLNGVKSKRLVVRGFPDSSFPSLPSPIKLLFESLQKKFTPHLVLTHYHH